jgi:hypothetical protein
MSISIHSLMIKRDQLRRKQELFAHSLNPWDQWLMTSKYKRFINMEVDIIEIDQQIEQIIRDHFEAKINIKLSKYLK